MGQSRWRSPVVWSAIAALIFCSEDVDRVRDPRLG